MQKIKLICMLYILLFSGTVVSQEESIPQYTADQEVVIRAEGNFRRDEFSFLIERIEFRSEILGQQPEQGIFAIVFGALHNHRTGERCLLAEHVEFIVDNVEYIPNPDLMSLVKDTLEPVRDYLGATQGHCLEGLTNELTFAVFDLPLGSQRIFFRLYEETVQLDIDWPSTATAANETYVEFISFENSTLPDLILEPGQYCIVGDSPVRARACQRGNCRVLGELLPGQVVTVTATGLDASAFGNLLRIDLNGENAYIHVNDATPNCDGIASEATSSATSTVIYTTNAANARECPRLYCDVIVTLVAGEELDGVTLVEGDAVENNNQWWQVAYNGQEVYVHTSLISQVEGQTSTTITTTVPSAPSNPAPTPVPAQPQQPVVQPTAPISPVPPSGAVCPSTSARCTEMTCEQAYACLAAGNRTIDRDGDGVPCESICPGG